MTVDREAAQRAIRDFLRALGHPPEAEPELFETPERVVAAYADELLSGYGVEIAALFLESSPVELRANHVIAVSGISVTTICPHHLLPALGTAMVAYVPGDRVLGLGTLAKLVDAYARRLTLQEAIGENVVQSLIERGGAAGAYCSIELVHGCLSARGPCETNARVVTVARKGSLGGPEADASIALALGLGPAKP